MPKLHHSLFPIRDAVRNASLNPYRLLCSECNAMATWCYMPAFSGELRDRAYCAEHVARGCSCTEESSDVCGRPMPCIEYEFREDGFRLRADGRRIIAK